MIPGKLVYLFVTASILAAGLEIISLDPVSAQTGSSKAITWNAGTGKNENSNKGIKTTNDKATAKVHRSLSRGTKETDDLNPQPLPPGGGGTNVR
jgi:hypothetical protein